MVITWRQAQQRQYKQRNNANTRSHCRMGIFRKARRETPTKIRTNLFGARVRHARFELLQAAERLHGRTNTTSMLQMTSEATDRGITTESIKTGRSKTRTTAYVGVIAQQHRILLQVHHLRDNNGTSNKSVLATKKAGTPRTAHHSMRQQTNRRQRTHRFLAQVDPDRLVLQSVTQTIQKSDHDNWLDGRQELHAS